MVVDDPDVDYVGSRTEAQVAFDSGVGEEAVRRCCEWCGGDVDPANIVRSRNTFKRGYTIVQYFR